MVVAAIRCQFCVKCGGMVAVRVSTEQVLDRTDQALSMTVIVVMVV